MREAQVAFEQGRLDEAAAIAGQPQLQHYLPVQQLVGDVAEQLARRGLERASAGDFAAAWRDLDTARRLAGDTDQCQRLEQAVGEIAMNQIVAALVAGDFGYAGKRCESLQRRGVPGLALDSLNEVIQRLVSAKKLGHRGQFSEADEHLAAAAGLRPDLTLIADSRRDYAARAERARQLAEDLHAAMSVNDWSKTLSLSNELLAISPDQRLARDARKRAWAEVGEQLGDSRRLGDTQHWAGAAEARLSQSSADQRPTVQQSTKSSRFMLWIDAVGGYLVCLGQEIILGQAVPGGQADVAIQADLSRKHARIIRVKEGYILEPLNGKTLLDGKALADAALLSDGDEFALGDSVKIRFRKPHVLSATARLEIISPHRTTPFADGVLLMAESCVLGPKWQNHVVCRDWTTDVVLYRADDKLMCRAPGSMSIDGEAREGRGALRPGSRVVGSDFSLTLERV